MNQKITASVILSELDMIDSAFFSYLRHFSNTIFIRISLFFFILLISFQQSRLLSPLEFLFKIIMQRFLGMAKIKPRILLRFIFVSILSMSYLLYRYLYIPYSTICYRDAWHQFTSALNNNLDKNDRDNVVIGIGQVLMDFWIVAITIFWGIKLKNSRVAWSAGTFFLFRGLLLNIMAFPFPQHIVWHSPGFISLTVPYDRTRDFFYSGHTGSLTIITIQLYTLGYRWITLIPFISLIYMMNMLLLTRVHYTIDVAAGLIFAYFFHQLCSQYIKYFDKILSIPYFIFIEISRMCKREKQKTIQQKNRDPLRQQLVQS